MAILTIAAMTLALMPAVADPLSGTDEYPDVAFLARNDVPFDAQTAASMAAQLGAPIFITNPNVLAGAARDGIAGLNPDVIIVAGGVFAVSDEIANEAAEACDPDCTIDRRFGAGRDQTAADLATIAADYGFDRPVLQGSNQVVGDVNIGGTLNADAITVQDAGLVSNLNADMVDGLHQGELSPGSVRQETASGKLGAGSYATIESIEVTLPDRCEGAPDNWTLRATANGYFLTSGATTTGAATMALNLDDDSAALIETVVGQNFEDSAGQQREIYTTDFVFTNVDAGTHTVYQLGQESTDADVTAARNRFIVHILGWSC